MLANGAIRYILLEENSKKEIYDEPYKPYIITKFALSFNSHIALESSHEVLFYLLI